MLQGLPEQRNGPAVADDRDHHHADPVPEHGGVESQMQGLVWVLPALDRPADQRAVKALGINAAVGQPALTTSLPAGRQATPQRQTGLPVVKTDRLAQQQPGHHPAQEHQMPLVAGRAVLTEKAGQLTVEPGVGIHEGLVWCRNPKLSRLPAHLIS